MAYEQKPGQGIIFKNGYKSQDNHPDYRGSILTPSGEPLELALWVKKSEKGTSYFSVAVSEPRNQATTATPVASAVEQPTAAPAQGGASANDDLPF